MAAIRTLGLVIRSVDVFETSRVLTLFTRDLGKVSALAKGARRLKSPFQSGLDLLGVCDIVVLHKGSDALDLLTEAVLEESFEALRRDRSALYAGCYIAELLDALTDRSDPHPKLFDAARVTLRHLGDPASSPSRLCRFELACLRELGLMPELDRCVHCGRPPRGGSDHVSFGLATGGVLCPECRPGQPHVATLGHSTLEAIRALAPPRRFLEGALGRPGGPRPGPRDARGGDQSPHGPPPEAPPGDRGVRGPAAMSRRRAPERPPRRPHGRRIGPEPSHRRSPTRMIEPLPRSRMTRGLTPWMPLLAALIGLAGCQGLGPGTRRGIIPRPSLSSGDPVEDEGLGGSLLARWIGASRTDEEIERASAVVLGPEGWDAEADPEATERAAEFDEAEAMFLQGDLDGAERAFDRIARKERRAGVKLFTQEETLLEDSERRSSPWGMQALYYLGEIRFQKGNYVGAHDAFEELVKDYPGTPKLDEAVSREFEIAQIWLRQAHPQQGEETLPWHAFTRGGLPVLDPGGSAVAVLEHVRQNDPTGPLADDAVQLIARHYSLVGDHETASYYYDQLINEHPKSDLLHDAMLSSVDSKMDAYVGPEYDFSGLVQARATLQRTMSLFPERRASTDDDLYHRLDLIADAEAERVYTEGEYYRTAGYVIAAEHTFGMIPYKWPKSEWADKARDRLAELARMPRKESAPLKIMTQPGGNDPFSQGVSSANSGGIPGASVGP